MECGTEWSDSTLEPANYSSTNRLQAYPARAGMDPRRHLSGCRTEPRPRTRGDEPNQHSQVHERWHRQSKAAPPAEEGEGMRFDLTTPCKNCPFRTDSTRITFAARERAEEIEEQAYRRGFPCHVSADLNEDPQSGEEGFVFGPQT